MSKSNKNCDQQIEQVPAKRVKIANAESK